MNIVISHWVMLSFAEHIRHQNISKYYISRMRLSLNNFCLTFLFGFPTTIIIKSKERDLDSFTSFFVKIEN